MVQLSWKQLVNVHNRELAIWNNGRKKTSDFLTLLGMEKYQSQIKSKYNSEKSLCYDQLSKLISCLHKPGSDKSACLPEIEQLNGCYSRIYGPVASQLTNEQVKRLTNIS